MKLRLAFFLFACLGLISVLLYWNQQGTPSIQTLENRPPTVPVQDLTNSPPSLPGINTQLASALEQQTRLEERISILGQENDKLKGQLTDLLNWILANVRGRYPVREQDLEHFKLPVINETFGLNEALSDFLKLSTDQTFLVEDAFEFTRSRLRVLQDANLELIQDSPNQIVMNIQSFPESGNQLKQDLDRALNVSIGPDKLARLKTVSDDTLNEAFDFFGQASRTLIFELRDNPLTGQSNLVINDGWFDEQNPDQLVYTESEISVDALPEKYRDFEIYLTENFSPVMKP